jgi:hypothetical protein
MRPIPSMEDSMITPGARSAVSLVSFAALTILALGACVRTPSTDSAISPERPALRFDNAAQTYVDVYFVGPTREWWLGRVAPGSRAMLRIPEEARMASSGFVRLAVLAGAPLSAAASRDPRATFTIAQPAWDLIGQRWTFSQAQFASPEIRGTPAVLHRQ